MRYYTFWSYKLNVRSFIVAVSVSALASFSVRADMVLTGDTKLACEALMCLTSSIRPEECRPSIEKFFSIQHKHIWDTLRGRTNLLDLCPTSSSSSEMRELSNALASGSGRCDAASFNAVGTGYGGGDDSRTYISSTMPAYCTSLFSNKYVRLTDTLPVYVGNPQDGGFWVEPAKYNQALADYNAKIAVRNAQRLYYQQQP